MQIRPFCIHTRQIQRYFSPETEVIKLKLEGVIATSAREYEDGGLLDSMMEGNKMKKLNNILLAGLALVDEDSDGEYRSASGMLNGVKKESDSGNSNI